MNVVRPISILFLSAVWIAAGCHLILPLSERGTEQPAFAFEGFGRATMGAAGSPRGYSVFHVTSLEDSGPGTLRDAVSAGDRYVVFDVAGTITLESSLFVHHSYLTIDGGTAPPPGITVVQPGDVQTGIQGRKGEPLHDVIFTNLRMIGGRTGSGSDILRLVGDNALVHDVVVSRMTASSSGDHIFSIYGEVRDVTISWNLVRKTLATTSFHSAGLPLKRISFHHNVLSENNEAQIKIHPNADLIDYVNNVVYGWGFFESGASGLWVKYTAGEKNPNVNAINNVFHHVAGVGNANEAIVFDRGSDEGRVFFSGNQVPQGETDAVSTSAAILPIPVDKQVTTYPARTLWAEVVPRVGTHHPTGEETALLSKIGDAITGK